MMSPEVSELRLPEGTHLERHPTPYVSSDEPVGVFDEEHRCLAVIETGPESLPPGSWQ
jgi:hypothetical protein